MGDTGRLLRNTFEARRIQLPARVTSIPLDADGKSLGYVVTEISGQAGVRVRIGPNDNYYPGDWIAAEQVGGGAGAQYVAAGYVAGIRPESGLWEMTGATDIGSTSFDAGDVVLGNPYDAHWWYDYSAGRWHVRNGTTTYGVLGFLGGTYSYAAGGTDVGVAFGEYGAGQPWVSLDATNGFRINNHTATLGQWTTAGDIRLFSGALETVHLDADGSGWLAGPDKISWDTAGQLTLDGELVTGAGGSLVAGSGNIAIDNSGITFTGSSSSSTYTTGQALTWNVAGNLAGEIWGYIQDGSPGSQALVVKNTSSAAGRVTQIALTCLDADTLNEANLTLVANASSLFSLAQGTDPALTVISARRVGIAQDTPGGALHVNQFGATAAVPVLLLEQGDDDQAMIELTGTVGTGNCIEAVGAKTLTVTHFVKVTITGVGTVYIPCGTIA